MAEVEGKVIKGVGPTGVEAVPPNGLRDRLDLSIAQLLREHYPALRLRERVRNDPLLERVTLGSLLDDPLRLDAFMEEFRTLPQCGATQVSRLRTVLVSALRAIERQCPWWWCRRPRAEPPA